MTPVPTFFFSHARQDREAPGRYLRCFFDDLESKLAQWAGVSLKERRLGTIDARVRHGEDWDADLIRGLRSDSTFVAILTPLYINRPNCRKELAVFLLRSPDLGIDGNGALMGARNVMLIRWLPENAYTANTSKDSLIPPILRRIEDTPADDGGDSERTQAIERYHKKGMEKCIKVEPYYGELLDLFVVSIRDMLPLPPGTEVSFATAYDAFKFNWAGHFGRVSPPAAPPSTPAAPAVAPRALASIVAFYVTRRSFTPDPNAVGFADSLIAETLSGTAPSADPEFDALLADVRAAGVAEGLTVFHAADKPIVPASPEQLLARLTSLSQSRVLTALVVEPTVWPGTDGGATAIEQIIRSPTWTGPVLLPAIHAPPINVDELVAARGLPPRLVALPHASEARVATLRRAFVDARGRVLRTSTDHELDAEHVPVLKGVGAGRG